MNSEKNLSKTHNSKLRWLLQRITAVALIPLTTISVIIILKAIIIPASQVTTQNPHMLCASYICIILFLLISLYHSTLGIAEIIEDYVHTTIVKYILLKLIKFIRNISNIFLILLVPLAIFAVYLGPSV
jgi:succinate dehydrogenase hydrophobic membrane anchor protein